MSKKTKTTIVFILISLAVGGLSALLTRGNMDIYETVVRPPLAPPAIVFPIVWTILYVLMGIGAARVYLREPDSNAITIFSINLAINFFWSIIFFNMRSFGFAFLWLLLLLAVVILMTVKFAKFDKIAAYLQIPYIVWLVFAGYLNLYIYLMN